jgi:hypothetical protein
MILLFTGINIGLIYWALSRTAPGSSYLKQLLNGALIGLLGGALIFLTGWLLMAVVFPSYIDESSSAALEMMTSMGMPKEAIDKQAQAMAQATPMNQAFQGFIGTLITSIVVAAIVAIFKRQKQAA